MAMNNFDEFNHKTTEKIFKMFNVDELFPKWITKTLRFWQYKIVPFIVSIGLFIVLYNALNRVYIHYSFEKSIFLGITIIVFTLRNISTKISKYMVKIDTNYKKQ